MGGALIFEVRSAAARREILKVRLLGPTAQVIAGGVKPNLKIHYSLETPNTEPLELNPKTCTVNPKR